LRYLDVGGGLGVDYDGSQTNFPSSINYTLQEYANDVVYAVMEMCEEAGVTPPTLVSESGRATVAHHCVLVVDVLGVSDLGARYNGRIAYHDACHGLRFLGLRSQARSLLAHVAEAELTLLPGADECCGFGGLFAIKQHAISEAMLDRKLAGIQATGAELLVTGDASCMTQIAGGLSRAGSRTRARHIAEVLANMTDRD